MGERLGLVGFTVGGCVAVAIGRAAIAVSAGCEIPTGSPAAGGVSAVNVGGWDCSGGAGTSSTGTDSVSGRASAVVDSGAVDSAGVTAARPVWSVAREE